MSTKRYKVLTIFAWFVIIFASWLLWSGFFKPLLIGLGIFSSLLTVYVAYRIDFFSYSTSLHLIPRVPMYWWKVFVDIVKPSIDVTKIVLDPKLPISPTEVKMKAAPKGMIGQAILGNSITLSPGTVTIDVYENELRIHCLTEEGAKSLIEGGINEETAKLTEK